MRILRKEIFEVGLSLNEETAAGALSSNSQIHSSLIFIIMGIQPKGAFGGFINKTGPLVGHIVNGQNVITSIPAKSNKPPTDKQLNQRKRFALITSFLGWMRTLIKMGFQHHEQKQTPMNKAVQYNLQNAVTGIGPAYTIDYANLRFSLGKCGLPMNILIESLAGAKVSFSWGLSLLNLYTKTSDVVNLVVYNAIKKKFVIMEGAATRQELGFSLQLPADFVGDEIHCFLNLIDTTGKVVSDSYYAGQLVVMN